MNAVLPYPEVFKYIPVGPYATLEEFMGTFYEPIVHKNPGFALFLVLDKTRPCTTPSTRIEGEDGSVAGHIGYISSSAPNLTTEIGYIIILPPFQRTHVTSNAVGLMMHYALDLPDRGGLGLRRMFWQASAMNTPSRRLAERMYFKFEGITRWDRVLPENKQFGNGVAVRDGDPRGSKHGGRDTAVFGHCWDDWEGGGRENIDAIMARTQ